MAARSIQVTVDNQTDQTLVKVDDTTDHGKWTTNPPDSIAPHSVAHWAGESRSHSIGTGVEGSARYHIGSEPDLVWLFVDVPFTSSNPFVRENTYNESGPGLYVIEHDGDNHEDAHVTFTIRPLPQIHAQTVRRLSVRVTTSSDHLAGTDNDVWFDIGALGWQLATADHNDFEAGETDTYGLDLHGIVLSPDDVVWMRLQKKGIFGVTGTWDGLDGAWKPESITLIVNDGDPDREELSFRINRWLNEDNPLWTRVLKPKYTLAEAFAHTLRMLPNNPVDWLSELIGALTTYLFKDMGISGWDATSMPVTCTTGRVIRTPAWSTDGLATIDLQLESLLVGDRDFVLDGFHEVVQPRFIRVEMKDYLYLSHTIGDKQRVRICGDVVVDTDQEMWYEIHPRDEEDLTRSAPDVLTTHSGQLVQSNGSKGSFELVVPRASGGLGHYQRNNVDPSLPWSKVVAFAQSSGPIDTVAMIESNFGNPGNLEVVARAGDHLMFSWRDGSGWHNLAPLVADGNPISGVAGNPAFIQSHAGWQGNFELVVPLASGGLGHYERNNDDPSLPWSRVSVFGQSIGQVDAVAMIESSFGSPGNLEIIARVGDRLLFTWRDGSGLHDFRPLVADGNPISGVAGNPSFIQSGIDAKGNFELVVPTITGQIARYWRNNADPNLAWHSLPTIGPITYGLADTVSLIQSSINGALELQLIARIVIPPAGQGWLAFTRDAGPAFAWGPPVYVAAGDLPALKAGEVPLPEQRFGYSRPGSARTRKPWPGLLTVTYTAIYALATWAA